MNEPEAIKPMDPSTLLVPKIANNLPIMPLGFHPESLPRHHSAFAAVLSKRKYDNISINGNAFNSSRIDSKS